MASWLSDSHGCKLHEGFANPCMIAGTDWGATPYGMFVADRFMLATIPIGALLAVVWIVVETVAPIRREGQRETGLPK